METWQDYLALAHRLADASGAIILPHFRRRLDVEDKERYVGFSPVTIADREAESAIRALIGKTYPSHGILGEEFGHENPDAEQVWVIDPIDGTKAFISGMPTWGTLIAFKDHEQITIGLLNQPFLRERFVGHPGGAFFGTRKIETRICPNIGDACLYATGPEMFASAEQRVFESLVDRVRYRRFGADCYAYVMLAMGLVDVVAESDMKPWDYHALIPIVEGAGGRVTSWNGGEIGSRGQILAVGDPELHTQVVDILGPAAS